MNFFVCVKEDKIAWISTHARFLDIQKLGKIDKGERRGRRRRKKKLPSSGRRKAERLSLVAGCIWEIFEVLSETDNERRSVRNILKKKNCAFNFSDMRRFYGPRFGAWKTIAVNHRFVFLSSSSNRLKFLSLHIETYLTDKSQTWNMNSFSSTELTMGIPSSHGFLYLLLFSATFRYLHR